MTGRVLYYPYINVPDTLWFTRILLYWDEVGAIIPYDYLDDPDKLNPHTRELVESELVTQVIPGALVWKIPDFSNAFLTYLNELGEDILEKRRAAFHLNQHFHIHIEKMDEMEYELSDMGLAHKSNYPWYDVERETAREFMAYLAASLGQVEDLQFTPISDEVSHLEHFVHSSNKNLNAEEKVDNLRVQLLEDLFPAPVEPLNVEKIRAFKEKYSEKLSKFRIAVEKEITNIADMHDPDLRQRRLDLFREEISDSIEDIKNVMSQSGYKRLSLSKIGSIITAIPGVPNVFGLAKAVVNALKPENIQDTDFSFLYAAAAQKELLQL